MTITPTPALPPAPRSGGVRAADAQPGQASAPGGREGFAAVLDGQLAGANAAGPHGLAADLDDTAPTAGTAPAAALEAMLAGTVAVPATPTVAPAVAASPAAGGTAVAGTVAAPAAPFTTATSDETVAVPDPGTTVPAPAPATAPAGSRTDAPPGTPTQPAPVAAGGLPDVVVESTGPADAAAPTAVPTGAEPAETSASTPTPGAVPAPAAATAGVGPTEATPASAASSPVLAQVTPALARVVTRGDGEHRMMLKLHPADLGEVHLTVTVRGDHVDVEIAAGAEARDVLREGSAQLRSLLESIGRTTGPLVLRDLPTVPTLAAGPGGAGHDDGAGASYAETGDGRRDQPDTRGGRQQPQSADQPVDRPLLTPRASGRTTVPGGPALDVTV